MEKGKPLAVIAIGAKPKPDGGEPDGDEGDPGEMAAAEDAVSAAKAGDASGFLASMKDLIRICMAAKDGGKYGGD